MPTAGDAARALAERLRTLRKSHWPDVSITQAQLATALEQRKPASVQLISSWERTASPTPPPEDRLDAIATFFSTRRSVHGRQFRLLEESDLTDSESAAREALRRELVDLRRAALAAIGSAQSAAEAPSDTIVGHGPWHFPGDTPITIVCSELPGYLREQLPFAGESDPDRAELSQFADLDSLFELHGHIRAVNPDAEVRYRSATRLGSDELATNLIILGGVDWNHATQDTMRLTGVPIAQRSEDADPSRGSFEVVERDGRQSFAPEFEERPTGRFLVQDVGQFVRAPNPLNRDCTVTVCNGMYGVGVYGAVRTLTDKVFRDKNAQYLARTFAGAETFSLLFRIHIVNGVVATPDWTAPDVVLHAWPEAA